MKGTAIMKYAAPILLEVVSFLWCDEVVI